MSVREQRIAIQTRMAQCELELVRLRESCKHPNPIKAEQLPKDDYDHAWCDYYCPDCGESWEEDL